MTFYFEKIYNNRVVNTTLLFFAGLKETERTAPLVVSERKNMADLRGRSYSNVRLYVVDKPIYRIKDKDGKDTDRVWMNISVANDKFENEKDFVDRPFLGFGRAYPDKEGKTQYDHSIPYQMTSVNKIARAVGLDPDDANFKLDDLRGKTFEGDLMTNPSKTYKGLRVNTASRLAAAEPLDKEAHDANTARARELREARTAELAEEKAAKEAVVETPEIELADTRIPEITDDDLPF